MINNTISAIDVTNKLKEDGYLQSSGLVVRVRGNQVVCSVPYGDERVAAQLHAHVLVKEMEDRLGVDAIPTSRRYDGQYWSEAILLTDPLSSDDYGLHHFLMKQMSCGAVCVFDSVNTYSVVHGTTVIGRGDSSDSIESIKIFTMWYFMGVATAKLAIGHDKQVRLAMCSRESPDLYVGTTRTVRQSLTEYRKKNGVRTIKRAGHIVCRIACGQDERRARTLSGHLSNAIWNHINHSPIPNIYKENGNFWAEAIILTDKPLSAENCIAHGYETHEFDDSVWAYFDEVEKKWAVMVDDIMIDYLYPLFPHNKIENLVRWYENGMQNEIKRLEEYPVPA